MKFLFFLSIALITNPQILSSPAEPTHFSLIPVADGAWAAIHKNPGGHAICNAGIIDLGDKTVIIDPFMNLDAAAELKAAAQMLTGKEAGIIINTHHHNDHIRGNQVFPSAAIISTEWTRQEIAWAEPKELQWEKEHAAAILASYQKQLPTAKGLAKKELPLWIDYFEGMVKSVPHIKTTLPTMTFRDSLWIHGTKRSIQLAEFENGHTKSDLAVFLPGEGIVFTGDLLFKDAHPWLSDGDPLVLKKYLDAWIENIEWKVFIPGHGTVGDKSTVQNMSNYISDLQQIVQKQKINGIPDSVIEATPLPEAYADWMFGTRFYAANLGYFCRQIK